MDLDETNLAHFENWNECVCVQSGADPNMNQDQLNDNAVSEGDGRGSMAAVSKMFTKPVAN